MQVFYTHEEWTAIRDQFPSQKAKIGFVPTMGALHQGHLDLVSRSISQVDFTVVSIFVNPTQFNNPEDYEKYPQSLEEDLSLLENTGVDFVFLPSVKTMYPQPVHLQFDFGDLERVLEGAFRPGHFNGVGVVVSKLFHLIQPHVAFFGQKDLQQVAIIRRLVVDLSFSIHLEIVPTRREMDGLAMSSRNRRLNTDARQTSLILFRSLNWAKSELLSGRKWLEVQNQIKRDFSYTDGAKLEYFELVETDSFELQREFDPNQKSSICTAAYVDDIRLIDNLPIIS